ncbi:MAG: hypothetical protein ACT4P8_04505 [Betaproteobacteria bacterium]
MKTSSRLLAALFVPAVIFAATAAIPSMAQDKPKDTKAAPAAKAEKGKPVVKVFHDDDSVRVFEVTFKPGDVGSTGPRPLRIVRPLKSGTLEYTFADGSKEKVEFKAGDVKVLQAQNKPYMPKNIGKSDLVLYIVYVKAKK